MSSFDRNLRKLICDEIDFKGSLSVKRFMEIALYHPKFGYYSNNHIIGNKGDFITAPEINQVFGELISVCLINQWERFGKPKNFNLIEFGPGKGTLMLDILRTSSSSNEFSNSINPILFEKSKPLIRIQKETLKDFNCTWVNSFKKIPSRPTFVIANEFLDSLPINQIIAFNHEWYRREIFHSNYELFFDKSDKLKVQPECTPNSDGDIIEMSYAAESFIKKTVDLISKQGFSAIFIDYGLTENKTITGETLKGIRNHQFSSILDNLGSTDISSWVNFNKISKIKLNNINIHGPISQKTFLNNLGIKERIENLSYNLLPNQRRKLLADFERLISINQMGKLFNVIGFSKSKYKKLPGFEYSTN